MATREADCGWLLVGLYKGSQERLAKLLLVLVAAVLASSFALADTGKQTGKRVSPANSLPKPEVCAPVSGTAQKPATTSAPADTDGSGTTSASDGSSMQDDQPRMKVKLDLDGRQEVLGAAVDCAKDPTDAACQRRQSKAEPAQCERGSESQSDLALPSH